MEIINTTSYIIVLEELKNKICEARHKAVLSVNKEMVLLYWDIGRTILRQQKEQGWGSKVIDHLARDLKNSFPDMKGFSPRNLKYMRAFAGAYPDKQIVQQLVAQIPYKLSRVIPKTLRKSLPSVDEIEKELKRKRCHFAPDVESKNGKRS